MSIISEGATGSSSIAIMPAEEMAQLIRSKKISPTEVLDATIATIEARNPSINALVFTDFEQAYRRVKELETQLARGIDPGRFAGVPTAMKDLFGAYPGWPATMGGIRKLKDNYSSTISYYPKKMEEAGAVMLGMTNSPVFGFRGTCDNPLFGPTRNPFDVSLNSGGSSGGSAAAVADGLLAIAGANDGGGSIRIPAAWCGVFGFQASYGRIPQSSRPNGFDMVSPFVYDGAVTRTVRDGALAAATLAAYDATDPFSIEAQIDWLGATRKSIRGMKIGYSPDLGGFAVAPEISQSITSALQAFESQGAIVSHLSFKLPFDQHVLSDLWCRSVGMRMAGYFEATKQSGLDLLGRHASELPAAIHEWVARGQKMSVSEIHRDQRMRTSIYDAFENAFKEVDLIVCPTVGILPVKNTEDGGTMGPTKIDIEKVDPLIGWCLTYLTNFSGHASASLPAGLVNALPVGLQIIGRRHGDEDVIAASAAFERARPWHDSYRICAERDLGWP